MESSTKLNLLPFFLKRQFGGSAKNIPAIPGPSKLNTDFLLKRFACRRHDSYSVEETMSEMLPLVCKFRRDSGGGMSVLAIATEDGKIMMLDPNSTSKNIVMHSWSAHSNAIFDLCWLPATPQLITVSGDWTAVLWDAVSGTKFSSFINHTGSVKCVDVCPTQSALFATGSRDGSINIWDTRVNRVCDAGHADYPEACIVDAHNQQEPVFRQHKLKFPSNKFRSVTSVAFQNEYFVASSGVADGTVKVWDLRKTYIVRQKKTPVPKYSLFYGSEDSLHGSSSLIFDSGYHNLFACCTDNKIYKFDCHTYCSKPKSYYQGFKATTYFVKLAISPDDQYLLSGSGDEKAFIWKVSEPSKPVATLVGHTSEVTAVAWHPRNLTKIATCSDDSSVRIWKATGMNENVWDENFIGSSVWIKSDDLTIIDSPENSVEENRYKRNSVKSPVPLKERSLTHFFSLLNTPSSHSDCQSNLTVEKCTKNEHKDRVLSKVQQLLGQKRKSNGIDESIEAKRQPLSEVPRIAETPNTKGNCELLPYSRLVTARKEPKDIESKENCDINVLQSPSSLNTASPEQNCNNRSPQQSSLRKRKNSKKWKRNILYKKPITSYFHTSPKQMGENQ